MQNEIEEVLKSRKPGAKQDHIYTGATDATAMFTEATLGAVVHILNLKPPKPDKPTKPKRTMAPLRVVFAAQPGALRISAKKNSCVAWSVLPAELQAAEPLAFKIEAPHMAHVIENWRKGFKHNPRTHQVRLSLADKLLEFNITPPADQANSKYVKDVERLRLDCAPAKIQWNDVWALDHAEGVKIDTHGLAEVFAELATAAAYAGYERRTFGLPTDFHRISVREGVAQLVMHTFVLSVRHECLHGLEFAMRVQDLSVVRRALRAMTPAKSSKKKAAEDRQPRLVVDKDYIVFTDGTIGCAVKPQKMKWRDIAQLPQTPLARATASEGNGGFNVYYNADILKKNWPQVIGVLKPQAAGYELYMPTVIGEGVFDLNMDFLDVETRPKDIDAPTYHFYVGALINAVYSIGQRTKAEAPILIEVVDLQTTDAEPTTQWIRVSRSHEGVDVTCHIRLYPQDQQPTQPLSRQALLEAQRQEGAELDAWVTEPDSGAFFKAGLRALLKQGAARPLDDAEQVATSDAPQADAALRDDAAGDAALAGGDIPQEEAV